MDLLKTPDYKVIPERALRIRVRYMHWSTVDNGMKIYEEPLRNIHFSFSVQG